MFEVSKINQGACILDLRYKYLEINANLTNKKYQF